MKGATINVLSYIADFFTTTEKVVIISFFAYELVAASLALHNLDVKQMERGQVLSECRSYTTPEFIKRNPSVNTPTSIELHKREDAKKVNAKHVETKKLVKREAKKPIEVKIKPVPKIEDHIQIKETNDLDTDDIKLMLKKHNYDIRITKHRDSL